MVSLLPQKVEVRHNSNVSTARLAARTLAESIGFDPKACEEIALATTELATNLIKHAQGGELVLSPITDCERTGLQITSIDSGPGIADVELALADRFSTTGTRGTGLGAVNRLMDILDITSEQGRGTRIVCSRWVRRKTAGKRHCPLVIGVATQPRQNGADNGDAFVVKHWDESVLVGVIDGLGHGPFALRAAQAARQYVESHFDRPLEQIFRGAGTACRATRGVVMALARFDWGESRLLFASIGNIEARVFPSSEPFRFVTRRGVIGINAPNAVVTEHSWPQDHMLVLHSDGLRTHWGWKDFPGVAEQPAQALSQEFLRRLAREEDDATVIVVRSVIP
jgi:anti-sigma regulatory factor (Ser/Thr protein kinase)/serine/threonine protein phosphatase PrpC